MVADVTHGKDKFCGTILESQNTKISLRTQCPKVDGQHSVTGLFLEGAILEEEDNIYS